MNKIRIGIMGPGAIAQVFARTVAKMEQVELYAVASRSPERAEAFAKQYEIPHVFASYEEMLGDDTVELIYVATPHSFHSEHIKKCLLAGKHVLCEKTFTINAAQAREVIALAQSKKLLLAEAIWPRYMPMAKTIRDFCNSDRIGKITHLSGSLGYSIWHKERLRSLELGGGALLDVGIYTLTFASIAFGNDISDISATGLLSPEGVDMQNTITLTYKDGRVASLFSSGLGISDRQGLICGERGYATIQNINNFENMFIYDSNRQLIETIERPAQITGFEYEITAAVEAIRAGAVECPQMPHSEIISIMEQMDRVRASIGLKFPCEA